MLGFAIKVMTVEQFIAESADDAVAQIRAKLGPEAVVLSVRQLPAEGVSRFWKRPRIEVLACLPDQTSSSPASSIETMAETHENIAIPAMNPPIEEHIPPSFTSFPNPAPQARSGSIQNQNQASSFLDSDSLRQWQVSKVLLKAGFTALNVENLMDRLHIKHGDHPPPSLIEEIRLVRLELSNLWPQLPTPQRDKPAIHIFVGPAGTGKTTCLCKWLVKSVLIEGLHACAWRLDGISANLAQNLDVFCDMLGVPLERVMPGSSPDPNVDLIMVDIPGIDWTQANSLYELEGIIRKIPSPQVHLVLNAAYEVTILLAQIHAFQPLKPDDLIVTHLDEEHRLGKIWNLVLGTKYPLRFLSAGQNIPGSMNLATSDLMLASLFPR